METQSDVLVVGAFERGWYVASSLAREGMKVTYVDVTASLGKFSTDEIRTPYGFFRPTDEQILEFLSHFELRASERGLAYLLEDGPVELGSPLTVHRFRDIVKRVPRSEDVFGDYGSNLFDGLRPLGSSDAFLFPNRIFYEPFFTVAELRKGHAHMRKAGVRMMESTQVVDVSLRRGAIEGVEVRGETSAFLTSSRLLWTLNDHESVTLLGDRVDKLRSRQVLEPDWLWVSYEFEWSPPNSMVPNYLLVVSDLDLPWCHDNYLILDRSEEETASRRDTVWARIPINQRFQKSYLEDLGNQILKTLQRRFRTDRFALVGYPEEMTKDRAEKGTVRFGLDSPQGRAQRGYKNIRGFFDLSPFSMDSETWDLRLETELRLGKRIYHDWLIEQTRKKGEEIDSTVQPS